MVTFVDTSALISLLDEAQPEHKRAVRTWNGLLDRADALVTTDYVRLETWSLLQSRFGLAAVRRLDESILPVLEIRQISEMQFAAAKTLVLAASRRGLSLVDATSFVMMKEEGVETAFAYDRHFRDNGFRVL